MDVLVPNLGDIDEVEVTELCVAVGDHVGENEAIIVIESDKASMEVPAGIAGIIQNFTVSLGDMVHEGSVIAAITSEQKQDSVKEIESQKIEKRAKEKAETKETNESEESEKVNVQAQAESNLAPAIATPAKQAEIQKLDVLVPDLGDIDEVEVIEVGITQGDTVNVGDLLLVLESDKASMEIPAEISGEIVSLALSVGDQVRAGSLIAVIATNDTNNVELTSAASDSTLPPAATVAGENLQSRRGSSAAAPPSGDEAPPVSAATDKHVYAGPAVRRLARELGADLSVITGTGNRGRLTKDDVKAYVKIQLKQEAAGVSAGTAGGIPMVPAIDFSRFGEIEEVSLSRIQKQVALNMHRSWLNVPHVTQHGKADITELEVFRKGLKPEASERNLSLTPLAFLVKACCQTLEAYPKFNSSLHADGAQIVLKKYMNIGIAVDTPDGLVVPVIRGANKMGIWQLCETIGNLAEKARHKKLAMDDLSGGTFTISSLGAIGGTGFTPIVNTPEVAILGVANSATEPVWDGEEFAPKLILPLSLSYDHRVINGVDGGRFMLLLSQILSDIRRLAL